MAKKAAKKTDRPTFEDGSFFQDVPMLVQDENGEWQVSTSSE